MPNADRFMVTPDTSAGLGLLTMRGKTTVASTKREHRGQIKAQMSPQPPPEEHRALAPKSKHNRGIHVKSSCSLVVESAGTIHLHHGHRTRPKTSISHITRPNNQLAQYMRHTSSNSSKNRFSAHVMPCRINARSSSYRM